jgi:hypothetical protein
MKKAFMLVAAVALLAAPVFAEVAVTISGSAETSLGYNLDAGTYGMLSEVSSDVEVVVGTLDDEKMGEGNWYGVITLEGAGLTFNSAGDVDGATYVKVYEYDEDLEDYVEDGWAQMALVTPDVTAKITNGNIYVQLQSEADFDADYVVDVDQDDFEFADPDTVGSLTVGGTFAPVTFAVEIGTAGSYADAKNAYAAGLALGANLSLDLAPITVDVAYAGGYLYDTDQETGFAVQVAADLAPVSVTVAFDGQILSGAFMWEMGGSVALDLAPITVTLDGRFDDNSWLDTKLTVGFANDMFTADAFFGLYNIINNASLSADANWETGVDVTVMPVSGIKLAAGWSFDSSDMMAAYANVAFTELVDNTTFTLGWEKADDMLAKDITERNMGNIYASAKIAY